MRKSHMKSHKKYFREILFVFSGVKIKEKNVAYEHLQYTKKVKFDFRDRLFMLSPKWHNLSSFLISSSNFPLLREYSKGKKVIIIKRN